MNTTNSYVYVVKQYQPEEFYEGETIYVYSKEEDAKAAARNLNKTYGKQCKFSKDGDFLETVGEGDVHYYTYESILMDDHIPEVENLYEEEFLVEVWDDLDSDGCSWYVAENDMKTKDINEALRYKAWDEAMSMLDVLEKLDLYSDCTLTIGRTSKRYYK